jgi:beta-mannanase
MVQFEALLGGQAYGVLDGNVWDSWPHMLSTAEWDMKCWDGAPYRMAISVPMLVNGATFAAGARGDYNDYFRKLAEIWVKHGRGDSYLRIGWEFNGGWYPWYAGKGQSDWVALFRNIVQSVRSVPGAKFKIVWNPTRGSPGIRPDQVYPGDDVVDIIGIDSYNVGYRPQDKIDPLGRWQYQLTQPYGLNWVAKFAAQHKKSLAVPEWGTGTRGDGSGYGDDPLYVRNMAKWIADNNVVFHAYWDYSAKDFDSQFSNGHFPAAAAEFKRSFAK